MSPSSRRSVLVPKLLTTLRTYDRGQFSRDLVAGVVVGIVALPLAIAFAIASGGTPDRGLWTAIVADYQGVFAQSGLAAVETTRPLARASEPYAWVSELTIAPWVIHVLGRDERGR